MLESGIWISDENYVRVCVHIIPRFSLKFPSFLDIQKDQSRWFYELVLVFLLREFIGILSFSFRFDVG